MSNRQLNIEHYAAIIRHNKEAKESIRKILADKYNKGEVKSGTYKLYEQQYERAEKNIEDYTEKLFNLNARLTRDNVIEIY